MILSDKDIRHQVAQGKIVIDPFNIDQLNPNSYNLRLGPKIAWYNDLVLDPKKELHLETVEIPTIGYRLRPGCIYLASTLEWTETYDLVPQIEGRSSLARLGISVHTSAGFGDNGFRGRWTLELSVMQTAVIYAGMEIAQIFYHVMLSPGSLYHGKYQASEDIIECRMREELFRSVTV